jgi:3-methylcrotonyl-CoA carboxylase alpha subunit
LAAAYCFLRQSSTLQSTTADPWQCADFWRGHGHGQYRLRLQGPQGEQTVQVHLRGDALGVLVDKKPLQARLLNSGASTFSLQIDQQLWHFHHVAQGAQLVLHDGLHRSCWTSIRAGAGAIDRSARSDGFVRAPMPGKLVLLKVQAGQAVAKGDELAVMEAMKMELSIKALADGVVGELLAETGRVLDADAPIMQWSARDV